MLPGAVLLVAATLGAEVRAFEVNPVTHPEAALFELNQIDESADHLIGPYFEALNCVAASPTTMCEPAATVMPNADGNFFVSLPDVTVPEDNAQLEDGYAEVAAYFHADRFYAYLEGFGVPPPLCFDEGLPLTLIVNVRTPVDDEGTPGWLPAAFYTGSCDQAIVLGQAEGADLAYDGDLVYHEVAHAAIDALSGPDAYLVGVSLFPEAVGNDPSALNEGLADFLSAGFTGDPVLGEYIEMYAGLGRRLDHDLACPQVLIGTSHGDGRAWAAALYELWERHGDPFYGAVLDTVAILPSQADFAEAAATLQVEVAASVGMAAAADVESTMAARGLVACERVLSFDAVEELHLLPDPSFEPLRPPPVQIELPAPAEPATLTVRYTGTQLGPSWTIEAVVGRGAPVSFDYTVGTSIVVSPDSAEFVDGSEGSMEIQAEAGERIFLALFNGGQDSVVLRDFTVEEGAPAAGESTGSELPDETDTDGETDPDADPSASILDDTDGCGCRHGAAPAWGWLLLVAFVARRRPAPIRPVAPRVGASAGSPPRPVTPRRAG